MLPFGMTIPATVQQRSEIPEELMNYPEKKKKYIMPDLLEIHNRRKVCLQTGVHKF
jgi:hypothetical protein